ncbi:MAG: TlpA disulfide reductase family protein [Pseudomonadota bacterium]
MPTIKHGMQLILLLLITQLSGCNKPAPVEPPKLGDTISDVTFSGLDKSQLTLASIKDKLVIVHFWATWCAPCRKEMPSLERLSQKLDPDKFALIGISVDEDINLVKEFKLKYGIKFAKFIDIDMSLAQGHFGATAFPETFIIGRDGKLVRHMMGEHEWDTPAMLKVLNDGYSGVATKAGAYW